MTTNKYILARRGGYRTDTHQNSIRVPFIFFPLTFFPMLFFHRIAPLLCHYIHAPDWQFLQ